MAHPGFQTQLIYGSLTPGAVPSASSLTTNLSGVELALNAADGKLFFKDAAGTVRVLATAGQGSQGVASITSGTIDGVVIGGSAPGSGTFTEVHTSSLVIPSINGLVKSTGNLGFSLAVAGVDYVAGSVVGQSNGVASLDAGGKVPLTQLPDSVAGGLVYLGTWNAATNTPTLSSGVGVKGYFYKVSVAGTTVLDGESSWGVDDQVIFGVSGWERVPVATAPVVSVNGMIGAVVITRASLSAAASGINSDITRLTGITTAISVPQGGTGATTLTGLVKGNGTAALSAAVAGTDYAAPTNGTTAQLLANNGAGGFTNVTVGTGLAYSGGTLSSTAALGTVTSVQASGGTTGLSFAGGPITSSGTLTLSGTLAVANGGTGRTTLSGLLKGNGTAGIVSAVASTDYAVPTTASAAQLLAGNGAGGFTNVTVGSGLTLNAGVLTSTGGGGGGSGSVTSVQVDGGTTGITFAGGPITTAGTMTMAGTLKVSNGGTGATTLTGIVRGNGTNALSQAVVGIDYAAPTTATTSQLLAGNGAGGFTNVSIGSGLSLAGGTLSSTSSGTVTSVQASGGTTGLTFSGGPVTGAGTLTLGGTLAVANGGTGKTTLTGLVKGNGAAAMTAAVAGTDYAVPTTATTSQLLAGNNAGGFTNVAVGSGLALNAGTLSTLIFIQASDPGAVGAGAIWVQP